MSEIDLDNQIAQIMVGIIQVRRDLDTESFNALVGAVMIEIDLGMQLAEELALERAMRPLPTGNVFMFPVSRASTKTHRTDP